MRNFFQHDNFINNMIIIIYYMKERERERANEGVSKIGCTLFCNGKQ